MSEQGQLKCYRCKKLTDVETLSPFDVISMPNGKEIVRRKFGLDAKMYMVSMCPPCYGDMQAWLESVKSVEGR